MWLGRDRSTTSGPNIPDRGHQPSTLNLTSSLLPSLSPVTNYHLLSLTSTFTSTLTTTTPPLFVYGYYRSIGLAPLDLLFDSDTPIDIARPVTLGLHGRLLAFSSLLSPLNLSRPDSRHPPPLYISIVLDSRLSI